MGIWGYLLNSNRGVKTPFKLRWESHVSSRVAAGEFGLLQVAAEMWGSSLVVSGNSVLSGELPQRWRAPFEVQQEINVPMDLQHGMQDSTGVLSWKSRLHLSLVGTQCSW